MAIQPRLGCSVFAGLPSRQVSSGGPRLIDARTAALPSGTTTTPHPHTTTTPLTLFSCKNHVVSPTSRTFYISKLFAGQSRLQWGCLPHCTFSRWPLPTRWGTLLSLLSTGHLWLYNIRGSINLLQLQSRFSWLLMLRRCLCPLVNFQLELETLMQVLWWALERLFSRYVHGSCYSQIRF